MGAETWYRGEAVGVEQAQGRTNPHDFADGLYLTDKLDVAKKYAEERTQDASLRRVWSAPVDVKSMKVLDLTKDARWEKFMKPLVPGLPGGEEAIKQANENYGRLFKQFITKEKIDLNQYDAVVGYEYVRGGRQLCILDKGGKATPLRAQIRARFSPSVSRSLSALPSTTPRTFMGKIGPGLKIVGATAVSVLIAMLADYVWGKAIENIVRAQQREIDDKINQTVKIRMGEVAETITTTGKAYAVIEIVVTEMTFMGNPHSGQVGGRSAPVYQLIGVNISSTKITASTDEQPVAIGGTVVNHRITFSVELSLSPEEIEQYKAYKSEMQWYDEQMRIGIAGDSDFARLSSEREKLANRFAQALTQ